ncbi:MAG TPA: GIY-YIG nuclease family protein [Candidatus Paceibacterota bacterium]|nr:GIY-YIG nuclease family protein [Candidatus Paceibacterota bacterium]
MYYVYILKCGDGSLYTGITNNLERRVATHRSGKGAAYTRARKVKKLLYSENAKNRSAALQREAEIKSWPRSQKLSLIKSAHRKRSSKD